MDLSQITECLEIIEPIVNILCVFCFILGLYVYMLIDFIVGFILFKIKKYRKERSATNESQSTWHTQSKF